jgi:glutathione S-transferase
MNGASVVLHQFPFSHFNEKARWGLDWKGVPHVRETYLPGPHAPQIQRLSGQTMTPVLVLDGEVIPGSARILDALERRFPERPLLPADPVLRRRALEIQERFDREVGPAARTVLFSVLIDEPDYLCRIFAGHRSLPVRTLYRATLPLAKGRIARANAAQDPAAIERAFEVTRQALDFVAKEVGSRGQLVGDSFSVADLACASLLAVLTQPPHPDMQRPQPMPERIEALLARFAADPAVQWVLDQYRLHRPPSAAVAA